jgi:hypothetical protein
MKNIKALQNQASKRISFTFIVGFLFCKTSMIQTYACEEPRKTPLSPFPPSNASMYQMEILVVNPLSTTLNT